MFLALSFFDTSALLFIHLSEQVIGKVWKMILPWNVYWTHHSGLNSKITMFWFLTLGTTVSPIILRGNQNSLNWFTILNVPYSSFLFVCLVEGCLPVVPGHDGCIFGTWETHTVPGVSLGLCMPNLSFSPLCYLERWVWSSLFFFFFFQTWGSNMQGMYSTTELQPCPLFLILMNLYFSHAGLKKG